MQDLTPSLDAVAAFVNARPDAVAALMQDLTPSCSCDEPEAYATGENYFPEELQGTRYYHPVGRGLEIKIAEKLKHLRMLDEQKTNVKYRIS